MYACCAAAKTVDNEAEMMQDRGKLRRAFQSMWKERKGLMHNYYYYYHYCTTTTTTTTTTIIMYHYYLPNSIDIEYITSIESSAPAHMEE